MALFLLEEVPQLEGEYQLLGLRWWEQLLSE